MLLIIVFESSWSEEMIKLQTANDLSTDIVGPSFKDTVNTVKKPFTTHARRESAEERNRAN